MPLWHAHAHAHEATFGSVPPWQQPHHMQAGQQPDLAPPPPAEDAGAPPPPPPPEPADTPMEIASAAPDQDGRPAPAMPGEPARGAAGDPGQYQSAGEQPGLDQPKSGGGAPEQQPQRHDCGSAKPAVQIDTPALEDVVTDDGAGTPSAAVNADSSKSSPQGQFKCACRPFPASALPGCDFCAMPDANIRRCALTCNECLVCCKHRMSFVKGNPSLLGNAKGNPSLLGSLKKRAPAAAAPGTAAAAVAAQPSPAQGRPTPPIDSSKAGPASPPNLATINGVADDAEGPGSRLENGSDAALTQQIEQYRQRKRRQWGPTLDESQPAVSGRHVKVALCGLHTVGSVFSKAFNGESSTRAMP